MPNCAPMVVSTPERITIAETLSIAAPRTSSSRLINRRMTTGLDEIDRNAPAI